jgi:hypothetical protein
MRGLAPISTSITSAFERRSCCGPSLMLDLQQPHLEDNSRNDTVRRTDPERNRRRQLGPDVGLVHPPTVVDRFESPLC